MANVADRPVDALIRDAIERTKRVQEAARRTSRELRGEPEPPEDREPAQRARR